MIRFGIVGFGLHAVRRLMPGFQLAEECKVVALSRRDPAKAAEAAAQYGIPHVFTSTSDLCACSEVDAVLVTTPNVCHLQDVLTAVAARKPVLCEKPMGMNAAECERMVVAARDAGVLLGVAQIFRFEPSVARCRELVAAGEIGHPLLARVEFCYQGLNHARTWIHDRSIAGGGPIADVGVHCIDALRFILGDEVVEVASRGTVDAQSGDVEASAIVTLRFTRGTLAAVLVSTRAAYRTPVEFVGDRGVLRMLDGLTVDKDVVLELWRDNQLFRTETISNRLAYARQVDSFAEAVQGKSQFPVRGEEGWRNQIILDAAYRSMTSATVEQLTSP
jgi:predicted dehydrogenase